MSDVKEIRRRARAHIEQGPVTAGYKDTPTILRNLIERLGGSARREDR